MLKKKKKTHTQKNKPMFFTTFSKRFYRGICHGVGGLQIQEKPHPCLFCQQQ